MYEPVGHSGRYMGKRIYNTTCHSGLLRSSIDKIINADGPNSKVLSQGGYNIIKKVPNGFKRMNNSKVLSADGIEDRGQLKLSVGLN